MPFGKITNPARTLPDGTPATTEVRNLTQPIRVLAQSGGATVDGTAVAVNQVIVDAITVPIGAVIDYEF